MFPDSKVAEQFSMERTKMSYVVSHGLGPYFHRDLVDDIKRCERFVLCFDEQTNNQNNKQVDLLFKHCAAVIRDCIVESFKTDGIELKRLLMIGHDNPNVNKSLEKLIDEEMTKVGGELLKIDPCHIHVVHNAFKAGEKLEKGPLIHLLHQELSDLYRTVLLSFLTPHYIGNRQGGELLSIDYTLAEKQLDNKQIRIDERELFIQQVKAIYHAIAAYLKLNLPLNNSFLRDVQILDSSHRSDPSESDAIVRVGRSVPGLLLSNEIDLLRAEWLSYSLEKIDESWIIKRSYQDSDGKERLEYQRIDFYWNNVLSILRNSGQSKYPTMTKLIKNVLIISHGNADAEREFSINQNIVTDNRTLLSEKYINGLRSTYDAVRSHGSGSAHKMSIGIETIRSVQRAASSYKEEMLRMKALVAANEQENKQLQKVAQLLIEEGTRRLENSLKKRDLTDAQAAHALIQTGNDKWTSTSEEMSKTMEKLSKIQQKRTRAEHEQSKKKQKLAHQQSTIPSDKSGN
ncbi:unnamed protein product [Didymodactylos carnosus]|uniref:HAT C-terminal dimerisation domain-containing protein n=1 Tax=Didymodactylos carnosus TaxID=1234261 RepID=A0A814TM79_9BILA|nr:unnamed protein product [Didymodactylos carnosus]CAF3926285.1 unnamed protein product [Didymodactylos carnosus]